MPKSSRKPSAEVSARSVDAALVWIRVVSGHQDASELDFLELMRRASAAQIAPLDPGPPDARRLARDAARRSLRHAVVQLERAMKEAARAAEVLKPRWQEADWKAELQRGPVVVSAAWADIDTGKRYAAKRSLVGPLAAEAERLRVRRINAMKPFAALAAALPAVNELKLAVQNVEPRTLPGKRGTRATATRREWDTTLAIHRAWSVLAQTRPVTPQIAVVLSVALKIEPPVSHDWDRRFERWKKRLRGLKKRIF
jgi:hypothetical protein